jgi:hypothetical protein
MKKKEQLTIYIKKLFFVYLIFLVLMSTFRVIFFLYYNELENFTSYYFDIFGMLFLGFRIDLTVIGYIQIIPTLLLLLFYYLKSEKLFELLNKFLIYYIFISFSITTLLLLADFGFYSYFKDHLNILFFGLFEDDTFALMETFWQNHI